MWGHVLTEASTQQNFNFGFSTYKSEILVHLSQWQYWWWFWFTIWWTLYYFIIIRVTTKRTFNFNVIMNTSVRGRGKWGDFLVALIPISWCCNILINSNFILRMIEWQNESSLFTIRIQGKQWYWVYKYDPNTANAVMNTPKNIGHNRWRVTSGQESYNADTYYQAIHLAAQLEFQDSYSKFTKKIETHRKNLSTLNLTNDKLVIPSNWNSTSLNPTKRDYDEAFITKLEKSILSNADDYSPSRNPNTLPYVLVKFELLKLIPSAYRFSPLSDMAYRIKNKTYIKKMLTPNWTNNMLWISSNWNPYPLNPTKRDYDEAFITKLEKSILSNADDYSPSRNPDTLSHFSFNFEPLKLTPTTYEFSALPHIEQLLNVKTIKKKYKLPSSSSSLTMFEIYSSNPLNFNFETFNKLSNESTANFNAYYDFLQLDETSDVDSNARHHLTTQPFRLIRGILNQHVVDILQNSKFENTRLEKLLMFNTKYSQSGETLKDKELLPETLWGFRQKKYKKTKKYKFKPEVIYDPVTFEVIGRKAVPTSPKVDIAGWGLNVVDTPNSATQEEDDILFKERSRDAKGNFNYRLSARINRHRSELVPVTLARRLLRTKRTLVLPAHVNLTLITNSYDVVHSWFVPGLGLKMDCVPGRSTHHTLYIDNIGFYYGQCAEICGRYHHHMPIRLCALPFDHFVVWWQSKGTARMNRTSKIDNNQFLNRKFNNPVTREKLIYRMN